MDEFKGMWGREWLYLGGRRGVLGLRGMSKGDDAFVQGSAGEGERESASCLLRRGKPAVCDAAGVTRGAFTLLDTGSHCPSVVRMDPRLY